MNSNSTYSTYFNSNAATVWLNVSGVAKDTAVAVDRAVEALKKKKDKSYPSTPRLDRRAKVL